MFCIRVQTVETRPFHFPLSGLLNGNNQLEHNDMALIEKGLCCGVYVPANKIEFVFVYVVHNYAFFSTWCTIPLMWYV